MKLKDLLLHETPFAFLVVDIDHFKSINDELSHLVGDKAIVNVSSELASYFKFRGASCVRFGGEEFLVILETSPVIWHKCMPKPIANVFLISHGKTYLANGD